MSRKLDDLSLRFKPHAMELLARCVEAQVLVMIVETLRSPAEHAANLATGVSWIAHSRHLDGDAIDIAPYAIYALHGSAKLNWDAADEAWQTIGQIGESLGLRWGGRWQQRDMGHFEYRPRPFQPAAPQVAGSGTAPAGGTT